MGDIHGAYRALTQCLERAGFDYENDKLIQTGDVADGYPQVYECVEELLKVKNLVSIKGNHDEWFTEFIKIDFHPQFWNYGGKGTMLSYLQHCGKTGAYKPSGTGFKTSLVSADIPPAHKDFFTNQQPYYIDKKRRCFVHGGFKRKVAFKDQLVSDYYWDRSLWTDAMEFKSGGGTKELYYTKSKFREIYLGHTPTTAWGKDKPIKVFNLINIDTGAGHSGRLTILDIATKEYWQSDPTTELYAEEYRSV